MDEYKATYEIVGGESNGFGHKTHVNYTDHYQFTAPDARTAHSLAMKQADFIAGEHLSSPETGETRVQLLSLRGPGGDIPFDPKTSFEFRNQLEHLLDRKLH